MLAASGESSRVLLSAGNDRGSVLVVNVGAPVAMIWRGNIDEAQLSYEYILVVNRKLPKCFLGSNNGIRRRKWVVYGEAIVGASLSRELLVIFCR